MLTEGFTKGGPGTADGDLTLEEIAAMATGLAKLMQAGGQAMSALAGDVRLRAVDDTSMRTSSLDHKEFAEHIGKITTAVSQSVTGVEMAEGELSSFATFLEEAAAFEADHAG